METLDDIVSRRLRNLQAQDEQEQEDELSREAPFSLADLVERRLQTAPVAVEGERAPDVLRAAGRGFLSSVTGEPIRALTGQEATPITDIPEGSSARMAFRAGQAVGDFPATALARPYFLPESAISEDFAQRQEQQRLEQEQQRISLGRPPGVLQAARAGLDTSIINWHIDPQINYEDLPVKSAQRLAFLGGRTLGDVAPGLLLGTGPLVGAARGVSTLPAAEQTFARQMVQPMVQSFAQNPLRHAQYELGAVAGAVHGRMAAEALFPGHEGLGYAGEIVGAIINPVGVGVGLFASGNSAVRSVVRMTKAGQKADAAQIVQQIAKDFNENPTELAAFIREGADLPIPVGAQLNSPTLAAVHNTLARRHPGFRQTTADQVQDAYRDINRQIDALYAAGQNNPQALRVAAEARQKHFENDVLTPMLDEARQTANTRIARMRNATTPQEAQAIQAENSRIVSEELHASLLQARTIESEMTDSALRRLEQIGESVPSNWARRTSEIVDNISNEAIPGEISVDEMASRIYGSEIGRSLLSTLEADPSPRKLWNLGKLAGKRAATARSGGDFEQAREFESLRRTILDDVYDLDTPALEAARVFSRALNDTYRRSFARTALPRTEAGQVALAPEQILDRAVSPGGTRAAANLRDLRSAVAYLGTDEAVLRAELAGRSQEAYLRSRASELVDPDTGRISQNRLDAFMTRNASVLEDFPQLRDQLGSVRETELLVNRLARADDLVSKNVANMETFGRLINSEDPAKAVGQILQNNPEQEMRRLAALARRFGTDERELIRGQRNPAVEGLKVAILDNVFQTSRAADGVSFSRVAQTLNTPLARGQDSLLELMIKNRVINRQEADRMQNMILRGVEIEMATNNATTLDDFNSLMPPMSMMTDLVARGMGSVGATNVARRLGALSSGNAGPSLIIARGGSKATQKLLGLDPQKKVFDIIMEAQTNPQLYAQLMEMPVNTPQQATHALRTINGPLFAAGVSPRFLEEEFEFILGGYTSMFEQEEGQE